MVVLGAVFFTLALMFDLLYALTGGAAIRRTQAGCPKSDAPSGWPQLVAQPE